MPSNPDSNAALFLDAVREFAGDHGVETVLAAYGGVRVSVPRRASAGHWLTDCFGFEVADKITRAVRVDDADGHAIGQFKVVLPLGTNSYKARTHAAIDERLAQGRSVRSIALELRVSTRSVQRRRSALVERDLIVPRHGTSRLSIAGG